MKKALITAGIIAMLTGCSDNEVGDVSLGFFTMKDIKMSYNAYRDFEDKNISLKEFKSKYAKKLEIMFQKQKNYLRKINREEALKEDDIIES